MYNLLVTGDEDVWGKPERTYRFPRERFLEHTAHEIASRFSTLTKETAATLCAIPALFAYEEMRRAPARLGRITRIAHDHSNVSITFEIDPTSPDIAPDQLHEIQVALGIANPWEMSRTHWAVKDVDLPAAIGPLRHTPEIANRIALKAGRTILDAAEPFEVVVEQIPVRVEPRRLPAIAWPATAFGLIEHVDGPWPQAVLFDCSWNGGKTQILASIGRDVGRYRGRTSLFLSARLTGQKLVWMNLATPLEKGAGEPVSFDAWFSLVTPIPNDSFEKQRRERRGGAVKALVRRSTLPLNRGGNAVAAFSVAPRSGIVTPSPGVALRRLLHLALLKLPFLARDQLEAIDGSPYLDPDDERWQLLDEPVAVAGPSSTEDEDDESEGDATAYASEDTDTEEPEPLESLSESRTGPSQWGRARLDLNVEQVRPFVIERKLVLSDALLHQLCAALSSGKHLLLVGPPGTGKSEIATALALAARDAGYCHGAFVATASADWSTFDTIGGYAMAKDGHFAFRSGVFLRAIEQRKWLLLDEINRADVDRSFGELMTVLAGGRADTPFTQPDGAAISIGPGAGESHVVPPTYRVLATMNTWDKTSLFRLSYAVQRRFAVVQIGAPDDDAYARILEAVTKDAAMDPDVDPGMGDEILARMKNLFRRSAVLKHRPLGPAVAVDMMRYQLRRGARGDGLVEAITLFLLPQLEGLEVERAEQVFELLRAATDGWAGSASIADLRGLYAELFPAASLSTT